MNIRGRVALRLAGPLRRCCAIVLPACGAALALAGCYTVDQDRYAASMHALLPQSAPTCARTRQRLLPSTCIERVNLVVVLGTEALERIAVPRIVCAGF